MRRNRQQGVALVVTLILLSVITFTAITFLVISRAEKGAVATSTDQTVAKLAAETGLERLQGEILASVLASTNQFAYDFKVTTNYINPWGFLSGQVELTNVSYVYPDGSPLSSADQERNVANLYYSPRAPVYVFTNKAQTGNADFRFYLDLNRNGRFEPNGRQPVIGETGNYLDTNGVDSGVSSFTALPPPGTLTNTVVGDPEWVGILERPDEPHSPSNRFVARYATVLVPSGKTLDLNRVHNQVALQQAASPNNFRRNMGVGTWEMNLASFLVDLNTNFWIAQDDTLNLAPYLYDPLGFVPVSRGVAFDDANALIRYRYDRDASQLRSVSGLLGAIGATAFQSDYIDGYGSGPFLTDNWLPQIDPDLGRTGDPWPGDDNLEQYFSPGDLFDLRKTAS